MYYKKKKKGKEKKEMKKENTLKITIFKFAKNGLPSCIYNFECSR